MALFINDQAMTKKAALEFLGVSPAFIPQVRRKIIECNTKQVDRDKFRPAKSIGGKPEYLVFVPHLEKEVRIRYATQQRPGKEHGSFVYPFPKTLSIIPAEDGTALIPDELEFLFWFLRPMCLQSPFRNKEQGFFYQFQDKDARATADMQLEEDRMLANTILTGPDKWDDIQLKHLAKGMNIYGVDDMTPMVVRNELRKLAFKDPKDFYNKATSREVLFSGQIQEAIDAHILVLKTLNGMQRWYFKEKEILPITYGQDPLRVLKDHMAASWYLYSQDIKDALAGIDIATKLNNPINDGAFTEEIPKGRIAAELSPEEIQLVKQIRANEFKEQKMQRIDSYDFNNMEGWHPSQKKSYEDNKEAYHAWKKAKELESAEREPDKVE